MNRTSTFKTAAQATALLAASLAALAAHAQTTFTTLHAFTGGNNASRPNGRLALSNGVLYGTAIGGGGGNAGRIFKMNLDGTAYSNIYEFSPLVRLRNGDGAKPFAGLVVSNGVLYGVASEGGAGSFGTVFKVKIDGTGFTTLYSFEGGNDGAFPDAGLVLSGSTLYGTTTRGGSSDVGTVFKINIDGTGFASLHSFTGDAGGAEPEAPLILSNGVLYGTTADLLGGGTGTVFKLNTNGTGFTTLYWFADQGDGCNPMGKLILDGTTLYGTTSDLTAQGGTIGTVFRVETNGTGFTTIHSFSSGEGIMPLAGLVLSSGVLYGTASGGGSGHAGTVFKLSRDGTGFAVLHAFSALSATDTNADGAQPHASLVLSNGTLYGVTAFGGTSANGAAFKVSTTGTGFANLHNFAGRDDGEVGMGAPVVSGGVIYGVTNAGGKYGLGAVFKVGIDGTGYKTLHSFTGGSDGARPTASLTLSGSTLYGTTERGGSTLGGVVFKLRTDGTGFATLHAFDAIVGAASFGPVTVSSTVLYGTTYRGGSSGNGTLYKLNTDGTGFATLIDFGGGVEGAHPSCGLVATGSVLYGTTTSGGELGKGLLFVVDNDGQFFAPLVHFNGNDGNWPSGPLTLSGTVLYGTTSLGGPNNSGTLFRIERTAQDYRVLYTFSGAEDGNGPEGIAFAPGPVAGEGTIYGAATAGGGPLGGTNAGTIYRLDSDGSGYVLLHTFDRDTDGALPGTLTLSNGVLYGVTQADGDAGGGTVFSLK